MADGMPHDIPSATVRLIASIRLRPVTYDRHYVSPGFSQTSADNRNAYLQPLQHAVFQQNPRLLHQIFHNNMYPVPDADLDQSITAAVTARISSDGADRHHRDLEAEIGLQSLIVDFPAKICELLAGKSSETRLHSRVWRIQGLGVVRPDIILRTTSTRDKKIIVSIEVKTSKELSVEEMEMLVEAIRHDLVSVGRDGNGNLIVTIDWDRMPPQYPRIGQRDRNHHIRVCAILSQTLCYLVHNRCNHGVITNYDAWIALHVAGTRASPILQVSDVLYKNDQPTEDSPWSSPLGLLICYHFLRRPGRIVLPNVSKLRTAVKQGVSQGRPSRGTGGPAKIQSSQHPTPQSEAGLFSKRIGGSFKRNAHQDGTRSTASAGYSHKLQQLPAQNMVTPPLIHSLTGTDSSPEQPSPDDIPITRPFQIEGLGRQDERAGVSLVLDFDRIRLSQAAVGGCRFLHFMPSPSLPFLRLDLHDEAGYLRHPQSNKYPSDDTILSDAFEHDPPTSGFVVSDGLSHDVNGYSLASHTDICWTTTITLEEPLDSGAVWDVYYPSSPLQTCVVKVSAPEAFPDDSDVPVYGCITRAKALHSISRELLVYNTNLLDLQGTVVPRLWGMWKGSQPNPDGGTIDLYISVMSNPGCMLARNESDYNAESDCNGSDHNTESDCNESDYAESDCNESDYDTESDCNESDYNGESDWSVEEKMVIVAQYTRLHNAGVLHGDVSPRHWIRAAGVPLPTDSTSPPTPSIFLIDFGFSVTIDMLGKDAWEQETRKEMQLVRSYLHL
ncbi:hypothetical protein L202_03040 [Cryptococcus amylolentus CBS 6039]|uniref:Protein kinase domain-containing protein n=1 Tax=Cryptococcus amylolentus CBS 6039 TaxID=1295533 RepID=A0A1E3HYV9_9TREE|nr:hypothetical protein L202_03040 [Cryptococcus amylolentus CBS 6039]ODN80916.1 hypothetical protein L202_03040 [Cryptococcus amylolentus CBS 6039]